MIIYGVINDGLDVKAFMFDIFAVDQRGQCRTANVKAQASKAHVFKSAMLLLILAAALFSVKPAAAQAPGHSNARQAGAALSIAIIIPSVLRILENIHPSTLPLNNAASPRVSALQRIVLISTLRTGFCVDLRLDLQQIAEWQLRLSSNSNSNVHVNAANGGYRLCTRRAGRYELALEHDFILKETPLQFASADTAMGWPVNVSLATP